jgi:hypothetical protein
VARGKVVDEQSHARAVRHASRWSGVSCGVRGIGRPLPFECRWSGPIR